MKASSKSEIQDNNFQMDDETLDKLIVELMDETPTDNTSS